MRLTPGKSFQEAIALDEFSNLAPAPYTALALAKSFNMALAPDKSSNVAIEVSHFVCRFASRHMA